MFQLFTELLNGVTVAMPMQLDSASRYLPAKTLTGCFCHGFLEFSRKAVTTGFLGTIKILAQKGQAIASLSCKQKLYAHLQSPHNVIGASLELCRRFDVVQVPVYANKGFWRA